MEDNLFTEGSSRKSTKPFFREKEDITDEVWNSGQKKEEMNSPPSKQLWRLPDCYILKQRRSDKHASSCVNLVDDDVKETKLLKDFTDYEESSSDEKEEESSSEDEDRDDSEKEDRESEDSDSKDEGTIGQIFREIERETFDANKRKKRFAGQSYSVRKVTMDSANPGVKADRIESETSSRGVLPSAGFQRPVSF